MAWPAKAKTVALVGVAVMLTGSGLGSAQDQGDHAAPGLETSPAPAAPPTGTPAAPPVDDASSAPPDETAPPIADAPAAPEAAAPPAPPPEPLKRPRLGAAVLQAVDKITAETLRFEARVGEAVRYKGLVLTVRACESTASDEPVGDSAVNLDVVFQPLTFGGHATVAPRSLFHGWMFASSPGLHPLEQPSYDVWLIACKAASV